MHKFLIVAALISVAVAEPPITRYSTAETDSRSSLSSIVDKALLSKVADILDKGGDGSDDGQTTNEGHELVDTELLGRIAQIINQNELSVGSNTPKPLQTLGLPNDDSYGAAPPPPQTYSGVQPPPPNRNFGNGPIELGQPQVARRIASFDIEDNPQIQVPSTSRYSLPSFGRSDSYNPAASSSRFELGEPEVAERIASFDIQGSPQSTRNSYRPPQARGPY